MKREIDEKPKRFDRVPFYKHTAPGPGWYDLSGGTMSNKSFKKNVKESVIDSHSFGSIKRKVFVSDSSKCPHACSKCLFSLATPGPGTYVAPSAFGYYISEA